MRKKNMRWVKQNLNKNMLPASCCQNPHWSGFVSPPFPLLLPSSLPTSIQTLSCLLWLLLSHRAWPSHNPWPPLSQTAHWFSAAPLYSAPHKPVHESVCQGLPTNITSSEHTAQVIASANHPHGIHVQTCTCWHIRIPPTLTFTFWYSYTGIRAYYCCNDWLIYPSFNNQSNQHEFCCSTFFSYTAQTNDL